MTRYCKRCGRMTEFEGELKFCPHCGAPFEPESEPAGGQSEGQSPEIPPPGQETKIATPKYVAWEDKGRLGFIGALFETWKESVFNPTKFYRRMPVSGGLGNPLLYGLILGFIGLVFGLVYEQFYSHLFDLANWSPYLNHEFDWRMYDFSRRFESISNLANIILFPLVMIIWLFVWTGISHLILLIFGWNRENFEATFRLIAYSEGPSFFAIVPILGGLIGICWQLVLVIIGIKEVHRLTVGQSLVVVFLPGIFCCFCCCGFIFWIAGLVGLAH